VTAGIEPRQEVTVTFLPHRLNRQPIIVRGLTADELWITVGISAAGGLITGIMLAVWASTIAIAPTLVVLFVAAGIFFGGGVLRRSKRGRPDTWLYRQIEWWLRRRIPIVAGALGASELITRSGYWSTRRCQSQ
jgi:conjugative transfer region protein (TIGR03750 family)